MPRKRLTQIFPWLLPIRKKQRNFCFYLGMRLDRNKYAQRKKEDFYLQTVFQTSCPLYNYETGCDMKYQKNKVFNLKLAAKTLDKIIICPKETFSFWWLVKAADKITPYKDGLAEKDGRLIPAPGGGLCQMSNLLFWMFLHTPMTIIERHTHSIKSFPSPNNEVEGVDATVNEGWLDLKVKNTTNNTFQIHLYFDEERIFGEIRSQDLTDKYEIFNSSVSYFQKNDTLFQKASVDCRRIDKKTKDITEYTLYQNICKIGYSLPKEILKRRF